MPSLKDHAQNGRAVERPADRYRVFLSSLAARRRALCASDETAQHGHAEAAWIDVSRIRSAARLGALYAINRRRFLKWSAATATTATLAFARRDKPLRIGITDWNLRLIADPAAVPLAKRLGFDGVQVSFGRKIVDNKMPLDNPDIIARYVALSRENAIPIDGTCVDRLHDNGLKSDKLAPKWVLDAIRLTQQVGTQVLLLPFFGRWALETQAEKDYTAGALRELASEAEKAGVILGLEDTISAEDNVRIMDKVASKNLLVYYDVGNSTKAGFDPVTEIRWLGKNRICQIHLKDNPHFLGEGDIQFPPIMHAIRDIGFTGFANLETDTHPDTMEADLRRNLIYIRDCMQKA
jgi:sugar phosphate isomerase/epimerase